MLNALVFRLWGPMAAWGDIAVGERRGSWTRPGKSAVLGLVAAALGYPREAEAEHLAMHAGLGFAVRVDSPGRSLRDYHTAQSPSTRRGAKFATRRDELAVHDLNTILSERVYYEEPTMSVALWTRYGSSAPSLENIETALKTPRYVLYLGRKACPPGAPLWPRVMEGDSLAEVFAAYDQARASVEASIRNLPHSRVRPEEREIWADTDAPGTPVEIVQRRDSLRHRGRWHFDDRAEGRLPDATIERAP